MEQLALAERVETSGATSTAIWKSPAAWLVEQRLSAGFWVFFTTAFFFDFGFSVYFFLFNLYLLDLHFNERAIGLIGGALTLGSVLGTLPAGWLARRIGLRPMMMLCMAAAPLMGIARTLAMSEQTQIGLAFLAGLAMCIWGVCFLPAVAGLTTEDNRASAFSLIFSVSIGTSAVGGVICGYLPQWLRMTGYAMEAASVKRLILVAASGIAALGLIPLMRLKLPPQEGKFPAKEDRRKLFSRINPFLLRYLPSMALWTAVLASFTPFANVYLSKNLKVPLAQIGLVFSASQWLQLCAGLLAPLIFRRFGLVYGIVATQVATAAAIGCLAVTQNRGLAIALYLSFSATQWISSPGLYTLLMIKVPPEEHSSAAAMTLFLNALFQSCATAGAGVLFAQVGYPRVLVGISALALTAALLFGLVVQRAGPAHRPS